MLVSFSVSNYRSFREEQTFSLVASKRFSEDHPEHTVAIPGTDERVLRFAVLYGANGAGKSNLMRAMQFLHRAIVFLNPPTRDPFRLPSSNAEPTIFDLQFIQRGEFYRFGLVMDNAGYIEEWLLKGAGDAEQVVYERFMGEVTLGPASVSEDHELALQARQGVRPERTFLGTITRTNAPLGPTDDAIDWIKAMSVLGAEQSLGLVLNPDFELNSFADQLLRSSGTGLDGVRPTENDFPDLIGVHGSAALPFEDESGGTQRLYALAPALRSVMRWGHTALIDEIERSLHPMIVHKIIEEFLRSSDPGQLIVTTHDSNLLDLDLLRRDEIWFAEKDRQGATHLYSLSDYPIRNEQIKKHYLQGRFGAIPFLAGSNLVALKES